jgi:hypothetical protein
MPSMSKRSSYTRNVLARKGFGSKAFSWTALACCKPLHASIGFVCAQQKRRQLGPHRLRTILKNGSRVYIVASFPRILVELVSSLFAEGNPAFAAYWSAMKDGSSQRAAVRKIARCDRRVIERQWVTRRWRPAARP